MGDNKDFYYVFRWGNQPGTVNGLPTTTNYLVNDSGEKYLHTSGVPPVKLITELSDLKKAMTKYQYGFIWIDDTSLPKDVQNYAKANFHEELYLESYEPELLENPYSIWPGTLYSWGFETENPFYSQTTPDIIE